MIFLQVAKTILMQYLGPGWDFRHLFCIIVDRVQHRLVTHFPLPHAEGPHATISIQLLPFLLQLLLEYGVVVDPKQVFPVLKPNCFSIERFWFRGREWPVLAGG